MVEPRETTRAEVENRMEAAAMQVRYNTYLPQAIYHLDLTCQHTPFVPTNMIGDDLQLADADISLLCGDAWCHQQVPNPGWNQFFFDRMHYTVSEWMTARDSDWLEGPPWLKVSLATWAGHDGVNPYRFLLEDDEVQILMGDPNAKLIRPIR